MTKNMNELRGLPKDLDLLLSTAKSIVLNFEEGNDLTSRIKLLDNLSQSVCQEYTEILKKEIVSK